MESQPSFEQLIKEDRATRDAKRWRGTLLEYLELIRSDPSQTKLAHSRVYEMIMRENGDDLMAADVRGEIEAGRE